MSGTIADANQCPPSPSPFPISTVLPVKNRLFEIETDVCISPPEPCLPRLFSRGWEEHGSLSWSEQGKVADSTMLFLLPVDQERKPGWRVRLRCRRGRGSLCSPLGKVGFIVTFNSFPVSKQRPPGAEASSWVGSYRMGILLGHENGRVRKK